MATESAPSIVPDYAAQGNDPYSQYVRSGQVLPSPAPVAAAPASAAPSPAASPSFDDVVKQAEQANGGKPLDESALDALRDHVWAQEEPGVWAAHKNSKGAVEAEKNAFDSGYDQWKKGYLAKQTPASGAPSKTPIADAASDFAKSAGGSLGEGAIEAGRYIGGGLAGIADAIPSLASGKDLHGASDAYYQWYDKNVGTPQREAALRQMQDEAAKRSPIAGGILGQVPGAIASAGVLPTMQAVGRERDQGGTVGQQEATLGVNTAANLASVLAPGASATRSVAGNVLRSAGINALIGGGQQVANNLIDPASNPYSWKDVGVQTIIGTALGALHIAGLRKVNGVNADGSVTVTDRAGKTQVIPKADIEAAYAAASGRSSPTGAAATPGAPTDLGTQPDGSHVVQDQTGIHVTPPGAGIPDEAHQAVVGEARNMAMHPTFHGKLPTEPAARAQEVVDRAAVIAQEAATEAGHDWTQMSTEQRQQATEEAAQQLATATGTQGVGELLQAQRTAAQTPPTAAVGAAATPVQETGEPPVTPQPGDQTSAAPPLPVVETPEQGKARRRAAMAAKIAHLPYAALDGQEYAIARSMLADGKSQKIRLAVRSDGSVTGFTEDGRPIDLTGMIKNGFSPEQAIATAFGDHGPNEAPDVSSVNKLGTSGSSASANPDVARATAEAALNGEGNALQPLNTPADPQGRTSAQAQQAGSPAEIQQHAALDAQLSALRKGLGKRITKATLDKMTLGDKIAMADAMQRQQTGTPASKKANVLKATEKVPAHGIVNANDAGVPRAPGETLSEKTPQITTRDIHLAGGVSQDGNRTYLDKRMPKTVETEGKQIPVGPPTHFHERVEWPLMKELGLPYSSLKNDITRAVELHRAGDWAGLKAYIDSLPVDKRPGAHEIATARENDFLRERYGLKDPQKYQDALAADIKKIGIANRHLHADIPADLDSQPNVDLGDTKPLEGKVAPARTAAGSPMLPADLSGARPRYNFGTKAFTLQFASDIDKAAYIAATKGSSADARYVDFVKRQTGMNEDQVRELGTQVRDSIKDQAKTAKAGQLTIDRVYDGESPLKKATAPVESQPLEPTRSSESADAKTFKTAKGSTYVDHGDGTTSRNKAYRPEHGLAEQGPMPRSQRTVYVDADKVNQLGEFQSEGDAKALVVDEKTKHVGIKYLNGKDTGKVEKRTVTPFHTEPAVGRIPVELWRDGTRVHFGNEIVGVGEGPSDAITALLRGKVSDDDLADVRALIERAQEGEPADLLDRIKELREDDTISADEAKQLRQMGRKSARPVGERVAEESLSEPLEDLSHERNAEPTTDAGKAAADVADAADRFTGKGLKSDTARAAELVAKVRDAFPDSPQHQKAADMLEWVLKQAPHLVRGVSDIVRTDGDQSYGGRFSPITRIVELSARSNMKASTAVHELLHASEPLMPAPIRNAIREARESEINRLASSASPAEKPLFEYLQNGMKAKTAQDRIIYMNAAKEEILKLRDSTGSNARLGELYALTNSSEYWAVHATDMLEKGFANRGVLARLTNWMKGFIDKLRELYRGNPNRSAVIDALHHVIGQPNAEAVGRSLRDYDIVRQEYAGQPEALTPVKAAAQLEQIVTEPQAAHEETNPRGLFDNFMETFANNGISFWRNNQTLRRLGFALKPEHNLYDASVRLAGQRSNLLNIDRLDVIEPIKGYFASNWKRFGKTDIEAVDKAGLFFQTHHALTERLPTEYLEQVPLKGGREVSRQRLLDRMRTLKISPDEAPIQLQQLVKDNASQNFSEWATAHKGKEYMEGLIRQQAKLAADGMTPETMAELNVYVQRMNDRTRQRNIESGKVAADDPMVKFYGWKWYVPLKGAAMDGVEGPESATLLPNELAAITRQGRGYITNRVQLEKAEGRQTWASNPLLRAIVDSGNASQASADHNFTAVALQSANDTRRWARQQALHAATPAEREKFANSEYANTQVHTYTGTPATGYTEVRTGRHTQALPQMANSLVHNDGRTHYIIQYPETSEVYHGLKSINTNFDPREFPILKQTIDGVEEAIHQVTTKPLGLQKQTKLITRSSQWLGQAQTIFNPVWTAMVQLPRTLMEKPLMLAIKEGSGVIDGSKLAAKAYADILGNTLTSGPGVKLMMSHDYNALRALGTAQPESFAGYWKRMNDAGGGTLFSQAYSLAEQNNPLVRGIRESESGIVRKGLRGYKNIAMGWSDALENISSVGIFKSLVKSGMSDAEAAAKTKDLLNFQQTGTAGKALNGYHAYFRITMTVNDTMLRAFQHPEGRRAVQFMGRTFNTSIDWAKVAKWTAVMAGYAAMKYAFDRGIAGQDENGVSNLKKAIGNDPYTAVQKSFLPVPGTDHPYALPVGLGFPQLLTAPGTLAAAIAFGDVSPKDAANAYQEALQRNVSIVDPVGTSENADAVHRFYAYALGALQPTAMQSSTDLFMNRNSFGQPIHTDQPNPNEFAADQGRLHTADFWKETAQQIQQHTGVDMFPETVQYVAQSWGGAPINDVIRMALGQGVREKQGLPDNSLAATSRLRVDNADYYYSGQMYKTLDALNETQEQLNHVKLSAGPKGSEQANAAGEEWLSQNPNAARQLQALNALNAAKKDYNTAIADLTKSNASPERKQYQRKLLDSTLRQAVDKAQATLQ
jgi:hypothetical protein